MKAKFKKIILLIIIILTQISCKKNKTYSYNFTVKNETKYKIESIEFQIGGAKKTLSIAPYSTSNTFNLTFEEVKTFPFDGSYELGYYISSYSDSTKTFINNIGQTYPQSNLTSDNKVNINVSSSGTGNNIFDFTFN